LNSEVTHNEEDPLSKNQDVDGLPEDMLHEVYDRATEVSAISFKVFPRLFISSHLWFSLFVRICQKRGTCAIDISFSG